MIIQAVQCGSQMGRQSLVKYFVLAEIISHQAPECCDEIIRYDHTVILIQHLRQFVLLFHRIFHSCAF